MSRRRAFPAPGRLATAVLLAAALTVAGCGSGGSATTAGGETTDNASGTPSPGSSTPASEPPADVTADQDLADWVAAVCTSSKKTLSPDSFTPDPNEIAADPEKAVAKLLDQWAELPVQLNAFADELEQIGAPDIENGEEFTEAYIDASRVLADGIEEGVAKAEAAGGGAASFQVVAKTLASKKIQAAIQRLAEVGKQFTVDDELAAAVASAPECADLS